jgi:hypothetical protein
MDLKDIIAIRGKGELYKVLNKSPKGIIVESIGEKKVKMKVQPNLQVLMLNDITIFSDDGSDLFLRDIFRKMFEKDGKELSVNPKSDTADLRKFFLEIAPNHDEEKVYSSDMKKILKWYDAIVSWYPEVIENLKEEDEVSDEADEIEDKGQEEKKEESKDTNK